MFENFIARLLVRLIGAYQFLLSPWVGNSCRYWPTCSEYARDALDQCTVDRAPRHALADGNAEPHTSGRVRVPGRRHRQPFPRSARRSRAICGEHGGELLRPTQATFAPERARVIRAGPARSGIPCGISVIGMHDTRRARCRQTARRLRPLARRAAMTARPPRDFMRTRNPCVRARLTLEGW